VAGARVRAGHRRRRIRRAPRRFRPDDRWTGRSDTGVRGPPSAATTVATTTEPAKRDLTVNKVVAGAGAAATSAVLGSYFGAMGTVGGQRWDRCSAPS
jgi:hypothetical protein